MKIPCQFYFSTCFAELACAASALDNTAMVQAPILKDARWIWLADRTPSRNHYAAFRLITPPLTARTAPALTHSRGFCS
ncbi:MAG: hypothetical protein HY360_11870 [Verrucomicrobia bacterium]|nr:hypothetical protein [Verrucomicrobiota bacterium]